MKYILLFFLISTNIFANSLLDSILFNRLGIKHSFNQKIKIGIIDKGEHSSHIVGIIKSLMPNSIIIIEKYSDITKNINSLIEQKVDIINMSMSGTKFDKNEYDAFYKLEKLNIPVVVAAGNDGINIDIIKSYPASYKFKNVISVANFKTYKQINETSNYGKSVFIGELGTNILSYYGNGMKMLSGTSQATPIITVAFALINNKVKSINKTKQILKKITIKNNKIKTGFLEFRKIIYYLK